MSRRHWPGLAVALMLALGGCASVGGTAAPAAMSVDPPAGSSAARAAGAAASTAESVAPSTPVAESLPGNGSASAADPTVVTEPAPVDAGTTSESSELANSSQPADPADSPEGNGIDACALVTRADAEKLVDTKVNRPVRGDGEHSCTYTGPTSGPTAQVEVYVGPGAKKQLDIERTLQHSLRKLPQVGEEAWIGENGVYLRKGQLWVSVLVVLLEDPQQYAGRLAKAASTAASRL